MPEYLAPGVYVEEVSFRPKSIEGVSTSTTAFAGPTRQGPVGDVSDVITSFGEFSRIYGGLSNMNFGNGPVLNYMAHAVRSYFDNGGSRLYIARTPTTGAVAQSDLIVNENGATARFRARSAGSGLNGTIRASQRFRPVTQRTMDTAPNGSLLRQHRPAVLTGGAPPFELADGQTLNLTIGEGEPVEVTFDAPTPAQVIGADIAFPTEATTLNVTVGEGEAPQEINVDAQDTIADLVAAINGSLNGATAFNEGNALQLTTDNQGADQVIAVNANAELGFAEGATASGGGNVNNIDDVTVSEIEQILQAANAPVSVAETGGNLVIETDARGADVSVAADGTARGGLGLPDEPAQGEDRFYVKQGEEWTGAPPLSLDAGPAELVTLNLEITDGDGNTLSYEELGFAPDHPLYLGTVLNEHPARRSDALLNPYYFATTGNVTALQAAAGLAADDGIFPLSGGTDGGVPGVADYEAALSRLEDVEDVSIVAAPGSSTLDASAAVQQAVISHAERMRYRIAVLDSPQQQTTGEVRNTRSFLDSTYAAFYYPWVVISNPLARPGNEQIPREITLPPSGFICGIYARNDSQRGVWKAPANEVVRGALRFEREINHAQQEVLNPEGINCLRYFYGRGNRVWGARTVSSDPEWKYVNVRRYFIYLERSIDRGTQWAVFEPNGEALWANIRETVSAFLFNEWRSGALLGPTPEDAYFVRCDRSTMTQNDLDNGRLICEIGVAVLKPAEFVIFRIGQKTADARD